MAGRELLFAIRIAGRLDGSLGAAVNSAQAQLNRLSKGVNKIGNAVTLGVAMAGAKVLKDSIETYKGYETAVNSAAAVYNVAKGTLEYDQLAEAARQVGRETVKSAQEGANALEYMGLAGWSVEKSTKALIPVVKLSAATGMDLATTSDLVTDTMAAMGIGIDSVGHYLDVLAKGNNSANYTSQMLLESLANVGGVFRSLNVGVEDGAAVLGILANQGTKGATAGTQLNTVLTRMQKLSGESFKGMQQLGLSMFDAEGNTRNIIDVFGDMYEATKNMTDEQRNQVFTLIGGTRGYRALTKIMSGFTDTAADGTPIIRSLAAAYRDADGSLENFYDIKTDTMEGALARLQRLYEDMGIGIGEALAPNLNSLIKHLSAKMPEISDVITGVIEESAPPVMDFLDYVIDNSDKIIDNVTSFAKAWTKFKIGSAATKELGNMFMLGNNLIRLVETKGVSKMLTTLGTGLTGLSSAALPVVGTLGGIAAGLFALYEARELLIKHMRNSELELLHSGDGATEIAETARASAEAANSAAEHAKQLREVNSVLSMGTDGTSEGNEAYNAALEKRKELIQWFIDNYGDYLNALQQENNVTQEAADNISYMAGAEKYAELAKLDAKVTEGGVKIPELNNTINNLNLENQKALADKADLLELQAGLTYLNADWEYNDLDVSELSEKYKAVTDEYERLTGTDFQWANPDMAIDALTAVDNRIKEIDGSINQNNDDITAAQNSISEYQKAAQVGNDIRINEIGEAISNGDGAAAWENIAKIGEYGKKVGFDLNSMGGYAEQAALKLNGFSTTNELFAAGGDAVNAALNDCIRVMQSWGAGADQATAQAALMANGFQSASEAASYGGDAINAVIADMAALGSQQGVFDGMDTGGVADKLSDMAHAMNLIPESKSISIDAKGNFGVIQEAENQIASLKSIGNVDVSLKANGDVSVLNEAGETIKEFQALGAVDLRVNADGNIDVINQAKEAIATIDKQTGQVDFTVNANVTPGEVNAEGFVARVFDLIMGVSPAAAAEMPMDANVTTGNVNVSGFNQGVIAAAQGAAAQGGSVNTTMNATVNAGSINTAPFAAGVKSHVRSILDGWGAETTINATANLNMNDNVTGAANNAAAAVRNIPESHNTVLSANGNALSMAQSVASAIAAIPTSKTVTISVVQNGSVPKIAHGIRNAPGGLYMVNDQNISDPRELIEYKGRRFWYEGRNVTTVLPQGANVYPAAQSKAFINGSHKSGLARVPFDGYIAELHRNERVLTSREAADYEPDPVGRRLRALDGIDRGQNNSAYTASGGGAPMSVTFSPTYVVQGNADEKTLRQTAKMSHRDFENYMKEYEKNKRRKSFAI